MNLQQTVPYIVLISVGLGWAISFAVGRMQVRAARAIQADVTLDPVEKRALQGKLSMFRDIPRVRILFALFLVPCGGFLILTRLPALGEHPFSVLVLTVVISVFTFHAIVHLPVLLRAMFTNAMREKMNEQLVDALGLICLSLRSGNSFESALALVARQGPKPLSHEFGHVVHDMRVGGASMGEALDRLVARVPFKDMRIFVATMKLVERGGRGHAEVLDRSAALIRERFHMKKQCRAFSAEQRFMSRFISLVPIGILLVQLVANRHQMVQMIEHPIGLLFLTVGGGMLYVGHRWLGKLAKFEM